MSIEQIGSQGALTAPYVLEYAYKRSLGPVLSRFFTAMRDGKLLGIRGADGRVLVPPVEYDPKTGASLDEIVDVADCGIVTTWTWVAEARAKHPLQKPFAFALIQLDGADTSMLHVVDAGNAELMSTGMRVRARWATQRSGYMTDIECFEPEGNP